MPLLWDTVPVLCSVNELQWNQNMSVEEGSNSNVNGIGPKYLSIKVDF